MSGSADRSAWLTIINAIKTIYSGPRVYAATIVEYPNVSFWDQLNFIGIREQFGVRDVRPGQFHLHDYRIHHPSHLADVWRSVEHIKLGTRPPASAAAPMHPTTENRPVAQLRRSRRSWGSCGSAAAAIDRPGRPQPAGWYRDRRSVPAAAARQTATRDHDSRVILGLGVF